MGESAEYSLVKRVSVSSFSCEFKAGGVSSLLQRTVQISRSQALSGSNQMRASFDRWL